MQHPLLFQLNTRVYLGERTCALTRQASFDDIPDALLEELNARGFEWLYALGVWQTGALARGISRTSSSLRAGCKTCLPDLKEEDIIGSPFAIKDYTANSQFGADPALARFRERVHRHGLKLMLDFVPNHVAPDHRWIFTNPEYLIPGTEADLSREPQNWGRFDTPSGPRVFAYGRDPYFPGWPDTVQLNYRHGACREAMLEQLLSVAGRCDGVRCDMAMLLEPAVFLSTWGDRSLPSDASAPVNSPFWPEATDRVRRRLPGFTFMAEVYWDLEWRLQQQGFDFTYDKRLYDRLCGPSAGEVRGHLMAELDFQNHSARFLENHDEPRAAAVFPLEKHRAAAIITFFVPGLRFFQEGQFEGWKTCLSMHLGRRPQEAVEPQIRAFYGQLLNCLQRPEVHDGNFGLWHPRPAWEGNTTWDQFVVFSWDNQAGRRLLAVVNYGPAQGQCYVTLGLSGLAGRRFTLVDLLSESRYDRDGDGLLGNGLYLDLPPWGYHLFELKEHKPARRPPAPKPEVVMAL